jgi:hypothetical protein
MEPKHRGVLDRPIKSGDDSEVDAQLRMTLSSPRKRGSSIPEAFENDREAAAYWIVRSSRTMTVEFEAGWRLILTLPAAA